MVDGALGMAFGQLSSTLLIVIGVPPLPHLRGATRPNLHHPVSGIIHVRTAMSTGRCSPLVIPACLGRLALCLTSTMLQSRSRSCDHLTGSAFIFYRGIMHRHTEKSPKIVSPLGLVGGFLDAAAVRLWRHRDLNLLVQGSNPRKTIAL
jgi:hypothetical protein